MGIKEPKEEEAMAELIQFADFSYRKNNETKSFKIYSNFNDTSNKKREYNGVEGSEIQMDNDKYFERLSQEFKEREERIFKNNELMEKRITEERRLSEERMEKRFNDAMDKLSKTDDKIDKLGEKLESKIDSTNKWITGLCISTIIGIAAIVVTAIVTLMK